jgi:Flp pilus assembly pilin Flp
MNSPLQFTHPALAYARALLGRPMARFAAARRSGDVGASAIELAVITAVLIVLAVAIGVVISNVVSSKCSAIANSGGVGGSCP